MTKVSTTQESEFILSSMCGNSKELQRWMASLYCSLCIIYLFPINTFLTKCERSGWKTMKIERVESRNHIIHKRGKKCGRRPKSPSADNLWRILILDPVAFLEYTTIRYAVISVHASYVIRRILWVA